MGNAQEKAPGRPDGGGWSRPEPGTPGGSSRWSRGGSTDKSRGGSQRAPERPSPVANGTQGDRSSSGGQGSQQCTPTGAGTGTGSGTGTGTVGDTSYLDAPAGALPPHLARLKNEGNHLFKYGQFGEAIGKYSQAIDGCVDAGVDSPEDQCILHSNRAACFLKEGNSSDCIQDCNRALELHPFSLKPLLRRAMANESLERYRKAYVDYKTVLQIDISTQAAQDSVHRITKVLIEQDGPGWREQLPDIPLVPLSAQQHRREKTPSAALLQARAERAAQEEAKKAEARFLSLKQEGNDHVRKGRFPEALEKYSLCLTIRPDDCSVLTNRAICHLRLGSFEQAREDCDSALKQEPANKKAFYRRALAYKGLQDYLAASSDLQEVLHLDPNVSEAEQELEEVTGLLRQSLLQGTTHIPRA